MTQVVREDVLGGAKGTSLATGLAAGATSLTVVTGGLSTWTPITFGRIAVVINGGESDEEHLYATGVSGDTLTGLIRGQDGTADQAHAPGATVTHSLFARHIDVANEFLSSPTGAGQVPFSTGPDNWGTPTNTLAGLTLTGATLDAPAISDFTNAGHDHLDANDGGVLTQAATHASPDTDTAPTALHHTLGAGANQAAPGTHPAATGTHGVTGAIVGTGGAQTLTDKTLVAPVIGDFTNATHDHGDADDGGAIGVAALPAAWGRGVVARHAGSAVHAETNLGAESPATMTATATLAAGRLYEAKAVVRVETTVANDVYEARIRTSDGFLIGRTKFRLPVVGADGALDVHVLGYHAATGSVTFRVVIVRIVGTGKGTVSSLVTDAGMPYFDVTDVGSTSS